MVGVLNEAPTNRVLRDFVASNNSRNYLVRFELEGGLGRRARSPPFSRDLPGAGCGPIGKPGGQQARRKRIYRVPSGV